MKQLNFEEMAKVDGGKGVVDSIKDIGNTVKDKLSTAIYFSKKEITRVFNVAVESTTSFFQKHVAPAPTINNKQEEEKTTSL